MPRDTPRAQKRFLLSPESIEEGTACIHEGFTHQLNNAIDGCIEKNLSRHELAPPDKPPGHRGKQSSAAAPLWTDSYQATVRATVVAKSQRGRQLS